MKSNIHKQSVQADGSDGEKMSDRKQWSFADMRDYSKAVLDIVEIRKQRIVFFVEENFANDEKRKKLLKMLSVRLESDRFPLVAGWTGTATLQMLSEVVKA